jgi:hypothetical protein
MTEGRSQVESGDDDVLGLAPPTHAAAGQHAGRRKHDALDRSACRRRPGGVGVVRVKQGHAPEQAAHGAAGGVCVLVGDAQRRQPPAPDARAPPEGSPVDRLLGGERQPEADLDAPAHGHVDIGRERGAVADGVAEVTPDGLVATREHVRGEVACAVSGSCHDRSVAGPGVVRVDETRAMRGRSRPALRAARSR